jgi:hypothetical protein
MGKKKFRVKRKIKKVSETMNPENSLIKQSKKLIVKKI